MSRILNLDKVALKDKKIIVGGKSLFIPAEISVHAMLRLHSSGTALEEDEADAAALEEGFRSLYDIFVIRQPELKFDEFIKLITPKQYAVILAFVFSDTDELNDTQKKTDPQAVKG